MRWIIALLAFWPGAALAWEPLDGPAITGALTQRVLGYPDGTVQDFFADGQTLHADRWGRWEVRGDRYCALWPPSEAWTCHEVVRKGLDLRFVDMDGSMKTGRYIDLN